jgi:hypothetical protein
MAHDPLADAERTHICELLAIMMPDEAIAGPLVERDNVYFR